MVRPPCGRSRFEQIAAFAFEALHAADEHVAPTSKGGANTAGTNVESQDTMAFNMTVGPVVSGLARLFGAGN